MSDATNQRFRQVLQGKRHLGELPAVVRQLYCSYVVHLQLGPESQLRVLRTEYRSSGGIGNHMPAEKGSVLYNTI